MCVCGVCVCDVSVCVCVCVFNRIHLSSSIAICVHAQKRNIKRDIGDFSGFTFEKDDPELGRRRAGLAK